ncbi:type IV toxin-antitoxin system AbiEi family antitoxin domain-containing protein [Iamia sp. SCSIO 61187]|uniref:type IV toxin-antitoxin system AbiEi family antitoxin domain-containing protein n=1 Tax=Iamia sp. SCSIO 61187 TaxID=2722752 RepID=UPI001C631174|nr:type IV toxin-antitoxin system AbiEi family antitoxin domain-containing protein [Iamia sp. SCSIO 61187]QYG92603.1 type IV toxin-antitoxin system AbiEi family antitoxin domain-containing protein [Iamia sp. SCSIO 61187]
MDPMIERAIAERASTQLGLITTQQLLATGMSRRTLQRRASSGLLVPAGRHTFRLAGAPADHRTEVLAAALDHHGVGSHRIGLWLGGLIPWPGVIDITVVKGRSTGHTSTRDGLRIHTSTHLPAEDITHVDGIAVTSMARSLMGVAALPAEEVPDDRLEDLVEDAVRLGLASDRWLWWLLEERRCRGRDGVRRFEAVLARRASLGPTESWLERALLQIIDDAGLPRPVVQRRIRRRGAFVARVDMVYDPGMIVLEALGYTHHATREQQNRDAARASELQLLGYDVHQITYDQVVRTPHWVAHVVRTALVNAGLIGAAA